MILQEHPDIVITETVERQLPAILPSNSSVVVDSRGVGRFKEEFDSSSDVLLRIEGASGAATLTPLTEVSVEGQADSIAVLARGDSPQILLPHFQKSPGKAVGIRMDVSTPVSGSVLSLFWTLPGDAGYSDHNADRRILKRGRQTLYFKIIDPQLAGRLRLHPGSRAGDYVLHSVEVRTLAN